MAKNYSQIKIMWLTALGVLAGTLLIAKLQNITQGAVFNKASRTLKVYQNGRNLDRLEITDFKHKAVVIADLYYVNGLYPATWHRLRVAASLHDPAAAYALAFWYRNVEKNQRTAIFWALRAKTSASLSANHEIYLLADKLLNELAGPRRK